jgi:two-component system, chemotaxis family, protein-glutamate methylesterase/glutaminase
MMRIHGETGRDIIVVGASAGGLEPVLQFVEQLPAALEASVFVVIHFPRDGTSVLPQLLNRHGKLRAMHPADGQRVEHGFVYVAPPDHHMIVSGTRIDLVRGPQENGYRPSIDVLMRSAARQYRRRVIGVVLSGTLDDGTAGLLYINRHGGVTIAQDPEEAMYPGMPRSAIENVAIDHVLAVRDMGPVVLDLVRTPVEEGRAVTDERMEFESKTAAFDPDLLHLDQREGTPATFTCPHCHGTLWETQENDLPRYRCRVGHAFSPDALFAAEAESVETALWEALRALEEMAAVSARMSNRAERRGNERLAKRFGDQRADAERRAETIRTVLIATRPGEGVASGGEVPEGEVPGGASAIGDNEARTANPVRKASGSR